VNGDIGSCNHYFYFIWWFSFFFFVESNERLASGGIENYKDYIITRNAFIFHQVLDSRHKNLVGTNNGL
jgi:hypothetical protein